MLLIVSGFALLAEREHEFAIGREFPDHVQRVVRGPDIVLPIHSQTVSYFEHPFAPAFDVSPIPVELEQRRFAAMQDVNLPFRIALDC